MKASIIENALLIGVRIEQKEEERATGLTGEEMINRIMELQKELILSNLAANVSFDHPCFERGLWESDVRIKCNILQDSFIKTKEAVMQIISSHFTEFYDIEMQAVE